MSFEEYTVKLPRDKKKEIGEIRKLLKQAEKLYQDDLAEIPTIHFDRHLYTPLVVHAKGKDFIKSVPPKLNEGETKFVSKLREHLKAAKTVGNGEEVFLLRNLSRKGVGFFQTSGFYPDFIMWKRKRSKQTIAFIDPKGIRNIGTFNDEKVELHKTIKDIETAIKKPGLRLESFILSDSKYKDTKKIFEGAPKEKFEENHILFMEDSDLIEKLLEGLK
jgi:hypothetical protein